MRSFSNEIVDYIHTKRGMKTLPTFGDNVDVAESIKPKKRPRVRVQTIKELSIFDKVKKLGYSRTMVKIIIGNPLRKYPKTMTIELKRLVCPHECKRMYPNCIEVRYVHNKVVHSRSKGFDALKTVIADEKIQFSIRGRVFNNA